MLDLAPGTALGAYVITARIGSGGMATVYQAHHPALDRDVAIKVISHQFENQPEFLERFRREARAASRLRHPNILTVYDFGEEQDLAYMVTELLPGGTLADRLGRPLPFTEILRVLRGIGAALDTAHQAGLIHRDVKPQNILYTRDNEPVLADFGIARVAETMHSLTVEGSLIGTPYYLAPEMASGGDVTPASDLYSLGVVLYEMLTGEVPFPGTTPIAVVRAHVYETPPPVTARNPRISRLMQAVVNRALAKNPADRHRSGMAMAIDFEEAMLAASQPTPRPNTVNTVGDAPPERAAFPPGGPPDSSGRSPGMTGGTAWAPDRRDQRTGGWPLDSDEQRGPGDTSDARRRESQRWALGPGTGREGSWDADPAASSRPDWTGSQRGQTEQQQARSPYGTGAAPGFTPSVPPAASYPGTGSAYIERWAEPAQPAQPRSHPARGFLVVLAIVILVALLTYALRVTGVISDSMLPFARAATPTPTLAPASTATPRPTESPLGVVPKPGDQVSPVPVTSPSPGTAPLVSPVPSPSPAAEVLPSFTPVPVTSPPPAPPPSPPPPTDAPDRRTGPLTVTFITPRDGDAVELRPRIAGRQTGERSPNQHLWLLIHPDVGPDNWWPNKSELVVGPDGSWSVQDVELGGEPGTRHVLAVGVVDEAGQQVILAQIQEHKDEPWPNGPPPELHVLARVTVVKR